MMMGGNQVNMSVYNERESTVFMDELAPAKQ